MVGSEVPEPKNDLKTLACERERKGEEEGQGEEEGETATLAYELRREDFDLDELLNGE